MKITSKMINEAAIKAGTEAAYRNGYIAAMDDAIKIAERWNEKALNGYDYDDDAAYVSSRIRDELLRIAEALE